MRFRGLKSDFWDKLPEGQKAQAAAIIALLVIFVVGLCELVLSFIF